MAEYTACTSNNAATVPPITGGTRQSVEHAVYYTYSQSTTGDTRTQCSTVRIGHDGLQN